MKTIPHSDLRQDASGGLHGSQEASTLGLKPGEWPESFTVAGLPGRFIPDQIFAEGSRRYLNAEPSGLIRATFTIWND